MSKLPLLELPYVVQREILPLLTIRDCINLSRCSNRAAEWTKSMKIPIREFSIRFEKGAGLVRLITHRTNFHVAYMFTTPKTDEKMSSKAVFQKPEARDSLTNHLCNSYTTLEATTAYFVRLLLDGFRIHVVDLGFDLNFKIDMETTISSMRIGFCDNLALAGTSVVNRKGLIYLLDNVKVLKTLRFLSNPGSDFIYTKPFKMENLEVKSAKWFSRGNLLSSNCVTISLTHSRLHSGDLNEFIFQWKQGAYKKLKKLEIKLIDLRMESVVKGLDAKEINVDRVREYDEKMSTYCNFKYSGEVHTKNGKTAAILETPDAFYFLVRADN